MPNVIDRAVVTIMDDGTVGPKSIVSTKILLKKFKDVEKVMSEHPDVQFGDAAAPLVHRFADGLYIREITMPKGMLVMSKIHKTTHPYFIMRGDVSVMSESGMTRITAPFHGITKAGTQRLLYMHEETVWMTVHATDETDLDKIEDHLIAKDYNDLPEEVKEQETLP